MPETWVNFQNQCLMNQAIGIKPVEKNPEEDHSTRMICKRFGVPAFVISNGLRNEKSCTEIIEDYQEKNIWKHVEYLKDEWVGFLPVWKPEAIEKFPNLFAPYLFPGPNKGNQVLTSWLIDNHGKKLFNKFMEEDYYELEEEEEEDSYEEEEEEREFTEDITE